MARDGFKIFDSDTHVGPYADILEKYLGQAEKDRLKGWEEYRLVNKQTGHATYIKGQRKYRRRLGEAKPDETPAGYMAGFTGAHKKAPSPKVDDDASERIKDMDLEGVDVNLTLPSGWFGTWTTSDDVPLETAMYRAYHRWMDDYCGKYPDRLGGVILRVVTQCRGRRRGDQKVRQGALGVGCLMVYAPAGEPLDHPGLEPLWKAAADTDLCIALHTFTVMPPYAPGGLDNWDNLWLQRSAAHPWCGMRNMASLIGAGVMERYPVRIGTLEAGHGWLPFWMARIDEHYDTIRSALPANVKRPSEYVRSGRYFQSIEVPEGEAITKSVMDLVNDDVLMYASDYPHGESHFPETVAMFLKWNLTPERKHKLLWNNAVKLYARSGLK